MDELKYITIDKDHAKEFGIDLTNEEDVAKYLYNVGLGYFYKKKLDSLTKKFEKLTFPRLLNLYIDYFNHEDTSIYICLDSEVLKNEDLSFDISIVQDNQNKINLLYDDDDPNREKRFNEFRVIANISKEKRNKETGYYLYDDLTVIMSFSTYFETCRFDFIDKNANSVKSFIIKYINTYDHCDTIAEKLKEHEDVVKQFTEDEYSLPQLIKDSITIMISRRFYDRVDILEV